MTWRWPPLRRKRALAGEPRVPGPPLWRRTSTRAAVIFVLIGLAGYVTGPRRLLGESSRSASSDTSVQLPSGGGSPTSAATVVPSAGTSTEAPTTTAAGATTTETTQPGVATTRPDSTTGPGTATGPTTAPTTVAPGNPVTTVASSRPATTARTSSPPTLPPAGVCQAIASAPAVAGGTETVSYTSNIHFGSVAVIVQLKNTDVTYHGATAADGSGNVSFPVPKSNAGFSIVVDVYINRGAAGCQTGFIAQ